MRDQLEEKYHELTRYFGICDEDFGVRVNGVIKKALCQFLSSCDTPAIWCYGKHTRMLMTDFIYEMRGVRLIIDNNHNGKEDSGFLIIGQDKIREHKIDGIIISSFKYKEEIKKVLEDQYSDIKYLDIYDILEKNGITFGNEYYESSHPYGHYVLINEYKRKMKSDISQVEKKKFWISLIKEYIKIKDFRSAALCIEEYNNQFDIESQISDKLWELCRLQQKAVSEISDRNVVMICIDGLRRHDLFSDYMDKMNKMLRESAYIFRNAYSVSTSTFESLIPAYSENSDLRTKYFEKNIIDEKNCRFIQTAIEQGRRIMGSFTFIFYMKAIIHILIHIRKKKLLRMEAILCLTFCQKMAGVCVLIIIFSIRMQFRI